MRYTFNAYEFTFAGESSLSYGLMICDIGNHTQDGVAFGNEATIIETRLNNRIQPIHFGVNYHEEPLSFTLIIGSERPLDRYEFQNIAMWLTGHQQYQWLTIDQPDLDGVMFHCLVTSLTPISYGWLPYGFEVEIVCDCPYAYGFPFEKQFAVSGETEILFRNEGSVREYLKPQLLFNLDSGVSEVSIVNANDANREFKISGLPSSGITLSVDNSNGIILDQSTGANVYDGFNFNFFRLVQGDNQLIVTGNGTLTISGRFLYNVAG